MHLKMSKHLRNAHFCSQKRESLFASRQVNGWRSGIFLCPLCWCGFILSSGHSCPLLGLEPMGQNLMGPAAPSTGNVWFTIHISTSTGVVTCLPGFVILRWRMRSSLKDRLYIVLISVLCFGLPALIIVISYLIILLTVRTGYIKMEFSVIRLF